MAAFVLDNMGKKRLSNQEIAVCLRDFGATDFMEGQPEPRNRPEVLAGGGGEGLAFRAPARTSM